MCKMFRESQERYGWSQPEALEEARHRDAGFQHLSSEKPGGTTGPGARLGFGIDMSCSK